MIILLRRILSTILHGAGGFTPYPVLVVTARDTEGTILATTKVVLPVSTEIGCSTCHGGSPELGQQAGLGRATAWNILAMHDQLSGTDLAERAHKGEMIRCRDCHADSRFQAQGDGRSLNLSAAMHGFHANYLRGRGEEACGFCHPSGLTGATRMFRDIHTAFRP